MRRNAKLDLEATTRLGAPHGERESKSQTSASSQLLLLLFFQSIRIKEGETQRCVREIEITRLRARVICRQKKRGGDISKRG